MEKGYIIIDSREPRIERFFSNYPKVRRKLEYGDYCIGNIGLERKTTKDLYSSIIDRKNPDKLRLQLKGLSEAYEKKALILEGPFPSRLTPDEQYRYKLLWHYILGIIFGWNIPVIFTKDERETGYILKALWERNQSRTPFVRKIKRRGLSLEERKSDILCCIPMMGRMKAKKLLEEKKTIWNILNTPKEELYKIKGVGKKVIDNLFKHMFE